MIEDYVYWIESHVSLTEDAWVCDHMFSFSIELSFEDTVKKAGYEHIRNDQVALDGYLVNGNEIIFNLKSLNFNFIQNKLGSNW